eukprot:10438827-Karenia_brevis.AAC.1
MLNAINFSAAISASTDGDQWRVLAPLLDEISSRGWTPHMNSFSAASSACEKGRRWQRVAPSFNEMRSGVLTLNVISLNQLQSSNSS